MKNMPEKLYYSISEVSDFTEIKAHVLRYWESEFPSLRPKKNRAGNRSYRRGDIEEVLAIKKLLYDEGYKIDGARRLLKDRAAHADQLDLVSSLENNNRHKQVAELKRDLNDLLDFLKEM